MIILSQKVGFDRGEKEPSNVWVTPDPPPWVKPTTLITSVYPYIDPALQPNIGTLRKHDISVQFIPSLHISGFVIRS